MMDLSLVTDATIALLGALAIVLATIGMLGSVTLTLQTVCIGKASSVKAKWHMDDSKAA